ncbi:hypothetical protein ThimaDRAFT_3722 [Thiocapsa marina 5811]|uniref:Uncharacterized protein n=1 Tax=Thiocapsa marina 5811 TaxID=768671 RepID=F9UFL9_9GAMM|nr:hypothetical protein ThimaDRAFT_3722 [Thiocapsa marina 5811]
MSVRVMNHHSQGDACLVRRRRKMVLAAAELVLIAGDRALSLALCDLATMCLAAPYPSYTRVAARFRSASLEDLNTARTDQD